MAPRNAREHGNQPPAVAGHTSVGRVLRCQPSSRRTAAGLVGRPAPSGFECEYVVRALVGASRATLGEGTPGGRL